MACAPEQLADVELFEHLNDEDRARLAQFIDWRELTAGSVLFHAGQPGDSLFVVKSGEIELYIKDNAGQKIALTTARAGQIFGELALLDHGPRTATAHALEHSELLALDRDDLLCRLVPGHAIPVPYADARMLKGLYLLAQPAARLADVRGFFPQGLKGRA